MARTAHRSRRTAERHQPPAMLFLQAGAISLAEIEAAGEGEGIKLPKTNGTAYTGGMLRQRFSSFPIVVDLATLTANASIPLLRDHDPSQIVGHSAVEISAQRVRITDGVISGTGEAAQEVVALGKNKFPWQLSIGANRGAKGRYEFIDKGETVKVNGRNWSGPLYVARDMKLVETSFVPVGADTRTSASIAAALYLEEPIVKKKTFAEWLAEREFTEDKLSAKQVAALTADYQADLEASGDEEDIDADNHEEDDLAPQKKRTLRGPGGIRAAGDDGSSMGQTLDRELKSSAKNTYRRLRKIDELRATFRAADAKQQKEFDGLIEAAIDDDTVSLSDLELTLMKKHRPDAVKTAGGGVSEGEGDIIAAALCLTAGMDEKHVVRGMDKSRAEIVMNQAMSNDLQGFGLHDLCAFVIRAAGHSLPRVHGGMGMLSLVRQSDNELRAAGLTTLSLPYVLGNIANKSLLPRFENAAVVWPKLATVRPLNDFKPNTSVRFLMGAEGLKKVGKDGKLEHLSLSDSKYTYSLGTRGGILGISRTDYINDDLGVFTEVPGLLGDLFAVLIEEEFFDTYINRGDWITSGANQNYMEGAAAALDIAALKTANTYWGNKTINGRAITATPKYLVVGIPLKSDAENLFKEKFIQPAAAKNTNQQFPNNPYVGLYEPVVTPYLSNANLRKQETGAALSGQSDTQWFLQADPNMLPVQIIGFLNGRRTPYVEVDGVGSWDSQFDVLGCQMRIFGDFGVGLGEKDGIFKSKGSA